MLNINYKNGLIITKEIMDNLHKKIYFFMKDNLKENNIMSYEEWIKIGDI